MDRPFQRKGAKSNSEVGRDFEAKAFFATQQLQLEPGIPIEIGVNGRKPHNFDLVDTKRLILMECKSHTWTQGGNVPSAKMTTWNQAMYFFYAAPPRYRKMLVVRKDYSPKRRETLGQYYIRTNSHLIPEDVEIWEFDEDQNVAARIK